MKSKNSMIKTGDSSCEYVLGKIMKNKKKRKLFVSAKIPIDAGIAKKNEKDYFISIKSVGKRFDNQEFYGFPPSLQEISLMVSDRLIGGEYEYLVLDSFEYLLTFYDVYVLEKFIRFLIRSSNEMNVSVVGIYEDNEQSSRLVPSLVGYF